MSDSLFSGPNDGFSSTNNHATYLFPPLSLLPVEVPPTEKIDAACQKDYTKLLKALKQLKISITGQITYTHSHAITRFKVRPTTPKDAAILLAFAFISARKETKQLSLKFPKSIYTPCICAKFWNPMRLSTQPES